MRFSLAWLIGLVLLLPGLRAAAPPNILLLLADDLGYADVGFNGGKTISTPNLDQLAATGFTLADFRSCPMCSPTRAGLLTGRWPLRYGLMRAVIPPWSDYGLPVEEKTLPELLAPAGYHQRGIVGKWHLGHARKEFLPRARGFTYFYGHLNGAIDYFSHQREGERDWFRNETRLAEPGYATDLLAAEAERFIQSAPAGQPWLLYVPFNAPHSPFQAKPEDLKKYETLQPPNRRAYAAMVDSLDQAVGRILAAVAARPDADNTLVLFFSDNGGVLRVGDNAPWRDGKLSVYEGGTRVCAAIRWPAGGLSGGRRFAGRIGYIDVLPTVLAAAGVALPKNLDGQNVLPALRGERSLPERPWFSYIHQSAEAQASVHLGRWKLVAHGEAWTEKPATAPQFELYDLEADPAEHTNLAAQQPDKLRQLQQHLRDFGTGRKTGVSAYSEGKNSFKPPKDWLPRR